MRLVTIGNDTVELPQEWADRIDAMPARIDREAGAALVTELVFPTTKGTVKGWPLNWSCPNGKALESPAAYLGYALLKARRASAGNARGFRISAQPTADAA
jgi:hypothetical protein